MKIKKFKIDFENIGRNNHTSSHVEEFITKKEAIEWAYEFADKFLMSSETSLDESDEENIYTIWAGFRLVGKVKIEEILK